MYVKSKLKELQGRKVLRIMSKSPQTPILKSAENGLLKTLTLGMEVKE